MTSDQRAEMSAGRDVSVVIDALSHGLVGRERGQAAGSAGKANADRSRGVAISQRAAREAPGGRKPAPNVSAGGSPARFPLNRFEGLRIFLRSGNLGERHDRR